jgi:hypothetical protein
MKQEKKVFETQAYCPVSSSFFFVFFLPNTYVGKKRVTYLPILSKQELLFLAQTKPDGKKKSSSQSRASIPFKLHI